MPESSAPPMIFLSYRRDDSAGHVGRLYDSLSAKFGSQRIFVDIDHISPGQDFVQVVDDAVARCAVLLVVMGKRWAGTGRIGKRRIDNPGDFVHLEVAGGLKRSGLRLIPVLVGGATMLGPAELPDDLKELARRNAFDLSDTRWKEDVARLTGELERALGPAGMPATPIISTATPRHIKLPHEIRLPEKVPEWTKWAGVAAAVLAVGFVARGVIGGRSTPVVTAAPAAQPTDVSVPTGDAPRPLPANLGAASATALRSAQQWRADAVLTQIDAKAPSSGSAAGQYQVAYTFRSPSDGAGLQVVTGISGTSPSVKRLTPVGGMALRPIPANFVDLSPAAQTARDSGMAGSVANAVLSVAGLAGRPGQPTWKIVPVQTDQYRVYYVDAVSGKLVHPTVASNTTRPARKAKDPLKSIGSAIGGIFKKH